MNQNGAVLSHRAPTVDASLQSLLDRIPVSVCISTLESPVQLKMLGFCMQFTIRKRIASVVNK